MFLVLSLGFALSHDAFAAKRRRTIEPGQGTTLETDKFRQSYWTMGESEQIGIIQNRKFSKANRFELSGFLGVTHSDPFLSVQQMGGELKYYFGEYFGIGFYYWNMKTGPSSAMKEYRARFPGADQIVTNPEKSYTGLEVSWAPLYGKISLIGALIFYQDIYIVGGAGLMNTRVTTYFAPNIGIGQQIYFTQFMAFNFTYRMLYYKETVDFQERNRFDGTVNLGLNFLF